jgi:hypothetical protein
MYSKLFASILDSSIWLEEDATRIVWLTLLAAKDGEGFARFAALENLARRANVSSEKAAHAVAKLEAPDTNSSNPLHEGRRVERVPGGWMVLNAKLYDDMVRREDERRSTRERVALHRARNKAASISEPGGESVEVVDDQNFELAWKLYPKRAGSNSKADALRQWTARVKSGVSPDDLFAGVKRYAAFVQAKGDEGTEFVKQAATFFGRGEHWKEDWTPPVPRAQPVHQSKQERGREALARGLERMGYSTDGYRADDREVSRPLPRALPNARADGPDDGGVVDGA